MLGFKLTLQRFLIRPTVIEKFVKSSTTPSITVTDVDLSFKETFTWIFSGLNMNVSQSKVDSIDITVQSESPGDHIEQLVENPEIIIHNSSFGSLDLKPGTKAQITDCYIDAQFKPRTTLITANNSDVSIQNCHFGNFINQNDSTILYGHYYSHVTIENSVFIQHNSSKGVLFLQNNCYMFINNSTYSHNVATTFGFSSIALDRAHAVVNNTVFQTNSALGGGAMIAQYECRVALTNCTFSSNKAITGKTLNTSKNSNLRRAARTTNQNTTTSSAMSSTLFNQTSLSDKKHKFIATRLLAKRSILKKFSVQKEDALLAPSPGYGGAVYVAVHSQLLVTNCNFEHNSAQSWGGAIVTVFNTSLLVQGTTFVGNKAQYGGAICVDLNATLYVEGTTFVGNKAQYRGGGGGAIFALGNATLYVEGTTFVGNIVLGGGGAINAQQQVQLLMTNCTVDDNISLLGGGVATGGNVTLDIRDTKFTGNRAAIQGGAISIDQQSYLRTTDCTFKYNRAEEIGGAIYGDFQVVLEINGSLFRNNSALQGGAINAQQQVNLSLRNCKFEHNFASGLGGAIIVGISVKLKIQETNFFTGNDAHFGGALYVVQSIGYVVLSVFDSNSAKSLGGAVFMESKSSLQLENTTFTNNNATDGGAIYIDSNSKLQVNMCSFWKNFGTRTGGAIRLKSYSTAVIKDCHFMSNHAVGGGAVSINDPEHFSMHSTSLLRNVASNTGGAVSISNGTGIIINNITCIGNQGPYGGGCLEIASVTLTLNNSDISENFANIFGAGVSEANSRIQVGVGLNMLLNANLYSKCHTYGSLVFIQCAHLEHNQFHIFLAQPQNISCRFRECFDP